MLTAKKITEGSVFLPNSLYCEHEIASNIWADVLDEWAKEHGWKERDA